MIQLGENWELLFPITCNLDIKSFVSNFFFWLHHMACGILVPQPGTEPGPSATRPWSSNPWTARKFLLIFLFFFYFFSNPCVMDRLSIDCSERAALLPTKSRLRSKSSTNGLAPGSPQTCGAWWARGSSSKYTKMYLKFCMLEHEAWHRINSYWTLFK